jgi:hypothetical protein
VTPAAIHPAVLRLRRGLPLALVLGGLAAAPVAAQAPPRPPAPPDLAESLVGGPEFWAVTGLTGNSRLNLRAEPVAAGRILARLANGAILRNLGCAMVEGEHWCRIGQPDGTAQGWVVARYLRESAAPPPPRRAPEPEPVFDAAGMLPCAMIPGQTTRDCPFGLLRTAPGTASLRVTGTAALVRWIYFDGATPVRSDGAGALGYENLNGLLLIRIGGERYEIPRGVIEAGPPPPPPAAETPAAEPPAVRP